MNGIDQSLVLQLFTGFAEILESLLVEKLHFAHCARRIHEPRNVVDDLPPGEFSLMQAFLDSLPQGIVFAGDGTELLEKARGEPMARVEAGPLAEVLATWAARTMEAGATYRPGSLAPNYIRPSDAEAARRRA